MALTFWALYWILVAVLQVPVFLGYVYARREKWDTTDRALTQLEFPGQKKFTYLEHGGMWALIALNFFIAYVIAAHALQWNPIGLICAFCVSQMVSGTFIDGWAQGDNPPNKTPGEPNRDKVYSSMTRNGLIAMPGMENTFSMAVVFTIMVMYYLFTPGTVSPNEVLIVSVALAAYFPFGLLQPPKKVHGKIHAMAWGQTVGGLALVFIGWYVRTHVLQHSADAGTDGFHIAALLVAHAQSTVVVIAKNSGHGFMSRATAITANVRQRLRS